MQSVTASLATVADASLSHESCLRLSNLKASAKQELLGVVYGHHHVTSAVAVHHSRVMMICVARVAGLCTGQGPCWCTACRATLSCGPSTADTRHRGGCV